MESIDQYVMRVLPRLQRAGPVGDIRADEVAHLGRVYAAQVESRHLDLAARWLQQRGAGFYTIGSAGHESQRRARAAVADHRPRAAALPLGCASTPPARTCDGTVDPVRETLRSLTCSAPRPDLGRPAQGVRPPGLHIIPQTSTIASHLPRAVGLGFALGLAKRAGPRDAVAGGRARDLQLRRRVGRTTRRRRARSTRRRTSRTCTVDCPLLFVCEDNGIGISTRTPQGWPAAVLQHLAGTPVLPRRPGHDPVGPLLETTEDALAAVRHPARARPCST